MRRMGRLAGFRRICPPFFFQVTFGTRNPAASVSRPLMQSALTFHRLQDRLHELGRWTQGLDPVVSAHWLGPTLRIGRPETDEVCDESVAFLPSVVRSLIASRTLAECV